MSDETQRPITVGDIKLRRRDGDIRMFQDDDLLDIPLSDAPAVAAAILKLAGAPDVTALVNRLSEAGNKLLNGLAEERGASEAAAPKRSPRASMAMSNMDAALADAQAWRDSREGK